MNKASFLLYHDYARHFDKLSNEELGLLLRAIMLYEATGNEPELDGAAGMAFSFIRVNLDRDREKWEKKTKANQSNGSKGGRPKTEDNPENPVGFLGYENNPGKAKKPVNSNLEIDDSNSEPDTYTTTTTTRAREEGRTAPELYDPGVKAIVAAFEAEVHPCPSPTEIDCIDAWSSDFEPELVVQVIQDAALRGKRSAKYIDAVLRNKQRAGITTLAAYQAAERDFADRKAKNATASARDAPPGSSRPVREVAQHRYTQRQYSEEELNAMVTDLYADSRRSADAEGSDNTENSDISEE